ncbi:MAG: LysM peptidoglycan-binding domain-containing protein [Bacteroidales bacterium]
MIRFFVFCVLCLWAVCVSAQDSVQQYVKEDSAVINHFDRNLDQMVNLWYVSQSDMYTYTSRPADSDTAYVPEFPDSVYQKRIEDMQSQSVIPLVYNSYVRAYMRVYGFKFRDRVEVMMGLAEYYFPLFETIFEQYNVPYELKYLSIIESALNPHARSWVGATGLWQFMPATGRMFDLSVSSIIDERKDPMLATHAAAQYLSRLHGMFQDWTLALAAYNCGPGNVRKAIARSGGNRDFWEIYRYLPRETRSYVPAFIAAFYIFEHHEAHNLYPREVDFPPAVDTVMVTHAMSLSEISLILDLPEKLLYDLNPQYKLHTIPESQDGMSLYLPVDYVVPFIKAQKSILAYRDSVRRADSIRIAQSNKKVPVYYTVKSGDNLGFIADWYDVRVSDVRRWNNIRGNTIVVGSRLTLYVLERKKAYYDRINSLSFVQKQQLSGSNSKVISSSSNKDDDSYTYYTVQSGDTLWDIAKLYNGVTISDLRRLNNLSYNTHIHPGMILKIKNL